MTVRCTTAIAMYDSGRFSEDAGVRVPNVEPKKKTGTMIEKSEK